jgi:hypothetical protein
MDWNRDKVLRKGGEWLAAHFSVEENPVRGSRHHYYYLYALERAGMLYGTEKFGGHAWYALGARYLLGAQERDGSWGGTVDTCFAILFLRRATRPLVATKSAFAK